MKRKINNSKTAVCPDTTQLNQTKFSLDALRTLRDRKLTQEEADFSAEHLSLVWWFLDEHKLSAADWFDVVIFRYLLTVKRWFTFPELQKYSFSTLAVAAMRSAVNTERRKQNRRPQTISLDAPYKGTYGEPLTEYIAA